MDLTKNWQNHLKNYSNFWNFPKDTYNTEEIRLEENESFSFSAAEYAAIKNFCKNHNISLKNLTGLFFYFSLSTLSEEKDWLYYSSFYDGTDYSCFPFRICINDEKVLDAIKSFEIKDKEYSSLEFEKVENEFITESPVKEINMSLTYIKNTDEKPFPSYFVDYNFFIFENDELRLEAEGPFLTGQKKEFLNLIKNSLINFVASDFDNCCIKDLNFCSNNYEQIVSTIFNKKLPEQIPDYLNDLIFSFKNQPEEKKAVIFNERFLNYKELNSYIEKFSEEISEAVKSENPKVVLILNRSEFIIPVIISLISLKITYIPVDVEQPEERIKYIISSLSPDLIITDIKKYYDIPNAVSLETFISEADKKSKTTILNKKKAFSNNIMTILYTSGSTGIPKGVMVTYENVNSYIMNVINEFKICKESVVLQQASYGFDTFLEETFATLVKGGTLVIADKTKILDFPVLCNYINENKVNVVSCCPLLLNEINKFLKGETVKLFISGGDTLKKSYYSNLKKFATIYNSYGPTETTVCATYHKLQENDRICAEGSVIGKPVLNDYVYIVKDNKLCPPFVKGEIWIGGKGVTQGYYKNETVTNEKFINNPFGEGKIYKTGDLGKWTETGDIIFLGRKDRQIKLRSFRIEPEEIENVIYENKSISHAEVVYLKEKNVLAAFFTANNKINIEELKNNLKKKLAPYMIPSYFVQVTEIPRTINGKINLQELQAIVQKMD